MEESMPNIAEEKTFVLKSNNRSLTSSLELLLQTCANSCQKARGNRDLPLALLWSIQATDPSPTYSLIVTQLQDGTWDITISLATSTPSTPSMEG
jgi:hypothetical protein